MAQNGVWRAIWGRGETDLAHVEGDVLVARAKLHLEVLAACAREGHILVQLELPRVWDVGFAARTRRRLPRPLPLHVALFTAQLPIAYGADEVRAPRARLLGGVEHRALAHLVEVHEDAAEAVVREALLHEALRDRTPWHVPTDKLWRGEALRALSRALLENLVESYSLLPRRKQRAKVPASMAQSGVWMVVLGGRGGPWAWS